MEEIIMTAGAILGLGGAVRLRYIFDNLEYNPENVRKFWVAFAVMAIGVLVMYMVFVTSSPQQPLSGSIVLPKLSTAFFC